MIMDRQPRTERSGTAESAFRRAQVYAFLSNAFLYPEDNWTEEVPLLPAILDELSLVRDRLELEVAPLADLQAEYRSVFGAVGSLCYETEYGLPHEFRQSQELADLNGFYRAFGFELGGPVRERPDHLAVELEFMHALALKEAYAASAGEADGMEICSDAQAKFLRDHLGRWMGPFARSLALNPGGGAYVSLARFAKTFVEADAARLGVSPERLQAEGIRSTPYDPDPSCAGCPVAGTDPIVARQDGRS